MDRYANDRLISMSLGGVSEADRRLVKQLMLRVEGVSAYSLADDGVLTVSLAADEEPLIRALLAAGIFPRSTQNMGFAHIDHGGQSAC